MADTPDGRSNWPAYPSSFAWRCRSSSTAACYSATPTMPARYGSPWSMRPCSPSGDPSRRHYASAVALRTARTVEQAAAEWNSAGQSEHYLWEEERLTATVKILGMTNDGGGLDIVTPPIVDVDNEAFAFLDATAQRRRTVKARERRRRNRTPACSQSFWCLR